ncbi:hypothetical protein TI03_05950 [Achromatium sp. WMS1]|nr:hypothetical protein TI03_05950 [Achromatium sp. WMS1]
MANLHDTDFYSWTEQQAGLLRTGNLAALDIANLIEEIEDMGRSEKRELKGRLQVLLMHLLKWQYQPTRRNKSWQVTIEGQRENIHQCLTDNPGMKSIQNTTLFAAYKLACFDAASETTLDKSIFPIDCPWSFEQVMSDDFWPE